MTVGFIISSAIGHRIVNQSSWEYTSLGHYTSCLILELFTLKHWSVEPDQTRRGAIQMAALDERGEESCPTPLPTPDGADLGVCESGRSSASADYLGLL